MELSAKDLNVIDLWLSSEDGIQEVGDVYYPETAGLMKSAILGMKLVEEVVYKVTGMQGMVAANEESAKKIVADAIDLDNMAEDVSRTLDKTTKCIKETLQMPDVSAEQISEYSKVAKKISDKYGHAPEVNPRGNPEKILVLSDLHIPYHDIDAINIALANEPDAGTLVLLGDIFDEPQHSKFGSDGSVNTEKCVELAKRMLDVLSSMFHTIYLVEGNHDARSVRKASSVAPGVKVVSPFHMLLLDYDVDGLPTQRYKNVKLAINRPVKRTPSASVECFDSEEFRLERPQPTCNDFLVIGDAVFCHGNKALKNPGVTPTAMIREWIPMMEAEYNLPKLNCIVQAHTHKLSKLAVNHVLGIECGALGTHQAYEQKGQTYAYMGYAVVEQRNGVTLWNKSTFKFIKE